MKRILVLIGLVTCVGCHSGTKTYSPAFVRVNRMETYLTCKGSVYVDRDSHGSYLVEFEDSDPHLAGLPDSHYKHYVSSVDILDKDGYGTTASSACSGVWTYGDDMKARYGGSSIAPAAPSPEAQHEAHDDEGEDSFFLAQGSTLYNTPGTQQPRLFKNKDEALKVLAGLGGGWAIQTCDPHCQNLDSRFSDADWR